jgi:hypothetical protein
MEGAPGARSSSRNSRGRDVEPDGAGGRPDYFPAGGGGGGATGAPRSLDIRRARWEA